MGRVPTSQLQSRGGGAERRRRRKERKREKGIWRGEEEEGERGEGGMGGDGGRRLRESACSDGGPRVEAPSPVLFS